ncbi:MAG: thiamine-phosphate kinase [Chloroflexi bacterium]|nr:thiamine-phosphate kinase [Chloroflexota bacterium]MCL5076102.1 thiamine-phosphate kinase [Chloroflexota bacterium]
MLIEDLGEFGFIDRLSKMVGYPGGEVVAAIGEDVAVIRTVADNLLLVTCDAQVENVHFRLTTTESRMLGRRALAVNLSDIAAMGGLPTYALVSLFLPPGIQVELVDQLYEGLIAEAKDFGVHIVGGNTSRSSSGLIIDITLLGEVEPEYVVYRSGARVGDSILVTGQLGHSAAGLDLLSREGTPCPEKAANFLKECHRLPRPRLAEGRVIATSAVCTAMIDISDGLAGDLAHICEASKVGALLWLDRVPVSAELRYAATALKIPISDYVLYGGEDYELLFTVRQGSESMIIRSIHDATGTMAAVIGRIVPPEEGLRLQLPNGTIERLVPRSHDHFRPIAL